MNNFYKNKQNILKDLGTPAAELPLFIDFVYPPENLENGCLYKAKLLINTKLISPAGFQSVACEADEAFDCVNFVLPGVIKVNQDQNPVNANLNGVFYLSNPILSALNPSASVVNANFFNGNSKVLEVNLSNNNGPVLFNEAVFNLNASGNIILINGKVNEFNLNNDLDSVEYLDNLNSLNDCAINAGSLEVFAFKNSRQFGVVDVGDLSMVLF